MGTIHNTLGLGEIHQTINIVYADTAERDADTAYSTNPDNVFKEAFITDIQELQLLIAITPTWITTMANASPGIDSVLAVEQLIEIDDRAITAIDDIFFDINWYDQSAADFTEASFLLARGTSINFGRNTGDGAGAITGTSKFIFDEEIAGIEVQDSISSKGLFYSDDYSSNWTPRSLVDKAYVDAFIHGNIYTVDGTIDGVARTVTGENSASIFFDFNDTDAGTFTERGQLSLTTALAFIGIGIGVGTGVPTGTQGLSFTPGVISLVDSINEQGIVYADDYSPNFVNRSLIDKAYADALINIGSDDEIIFNDNGVLVGKSNFLFDHDNDFLRLGNTTDPMRLVIHRGGTVPAGVVFPDNASAINTQGDNTNNADIIAACVADTAFGNANIVMQRAGATANLLVNGDVLGQYRFEGHDGVNYQNAAGIRGRVDGVAAAGDMPARMEFLTVGPGTTTLLERMRIDSAGDIGIGTTSPDARLHVQTGNASVSPLTNRQFITEGTGGGGGIALMGEETTELSMVFGFPSNNGLGGIFYFPGNGMQLRTNGANTRLALLEDGNIGINDSTPTSRLDLDGSLSVGRLASATSVSSVDEVIIGITDTSLVRTVTLQTTDIVATRLFIIKDESGAAGTNNITVATQAAETIDGLASVDITANYGVLRLYSDGTNLFSW